MSHLTLFMSKNAGLVVVHMKLTESLLAEVSVLHEAKQIFSSPEVGACLGGWATEQAGR
jgi:hypothetical protein